MTATLLILIKGSVFALILASGMRARWNDLLHLWYRPKLLVRSMLAMYVLVPLLAFALVKLFNLTSGVKVGLLVLAASAGAPLLPRKVAKYDQGAYALSLVVLSSLLAVVVVPAWVAIFAAHFGVSAPLAVSEVAFIVAKSFLLPLVLGMMLGTRLSWLSKLLADRILLLAGVVLIVSALMLLALHWEVLLSLRAQGFIALSVMLILALAIGHLLGGPLPEERTVLAIACATRHIGVAVIFAATFPGVKTMVLLIVYVLTAAVVSGGYLRWRYRRG